jgi:hypothetical protein
MRAMTRPTLALAALLSACGSAANGASSPIVSGDSCALHQDATSCLADPQICRWYANTRPCLAGEPCPAGWCYHPQPDGGIDGGGVGAGSAQAACACPGSGQACMVQIGGPAIQVEPPVECVTMPAGCTLADRCGCLAQGGLERCWTSETVSGLCVCDNGVR